MIHDVAAFLGIAVLVIVTPGQDTALVIRNSLRGGRPGGVFTAVGVSSGQAVWTVATAAGVAALLTASEPAFKALKLAGAAYLVLLGAHALLGALRGHSSPAGTGLDTPPSLLSPRAAVRQGLLSNLGNPKMAVFFTSLLPQFAGDGGASFGGLLLLGLVFCLLTLVWLSGYAAAISRAGDVLRRPSVRRVVDTITGAVLVAFGLRLATEQR